MFDNLTEKERLFIEHYLTDCNFNGGKSATKAGYSYNSRYEIAYELLRKPQIASYVKQYLEQTSIGKQELLKRLTDVARNVGSEYILLDGSIDLEALLKDGYGHLVKEVRKYKSGKIRVVFHDSSKALADLARIHRLIDEGLSVTVNVNERIEQDKYHGVVLSEIRQKLIPQGTEMSLKEYFDQIIANRRNTNELESKCESNQP
jgi:hypothetical protein